VGAIIAIVYSLLNFFYFGDPIFGVIWLAWSFLWTLFFILLALKRRHIPLHWWVTMIVAWTTCVIPAYLLMTGTFPS
jgi:hypothetical protein